MPQLSHLSPSGEADMVDVSGKAMTEREAVAEGRIVMRPETLDLALSGNAKKGDVSRRRESPQSWRRRRPMN